MQIGRRKIRGVCSIDLMAISTYLVDQNKVFAEEQKYRDFIYNVRVAKLLQDPHTPEDNLPKAIFRPEALPIRRSKGEKPKHVVIKWGSVVGCNGADVNGLLDYLAEEGRNCHINTGVHGKEVDGKFEWAHELDGGDFLHQDVMNAGLKKIKISLHVITEATMPVYHSGVDTIDAFCLSNLKKLSEDELDKAYDDFLVKLKEKPDRVKNDEKNDGKEQVDAPIDLHELAVDISQADQGSYTIIRKSTIIIALVLFLTLVGGLVYGILATK